MMLCPVDVELLSDGDGIGVKFQSFPFSDGIIHHRHHHLRLCLNLLPFDLHPRLELPLRP